MYRTPTHEPRYKQRTRDRESRGKARRYEEPKESTEGSSSDEDEESTDRCTEETEDTTESQHGREDCEWNAASSSFDRDKIFARFNRPEDFLMRAYYANERVQKHDKITQKNFLSPFPSFLIPPIYREGVGPQNYRFAGVSNPAEDQDVKINSGKPSRGAPKKLDSYEEENICTRYSNRDRKLCDKHKAEREAKNFSRNWRPERILTCVQGESSMDPSSILSRNAFDTEGFSRNSPKPEDGKKPKSVCRENRVDEFSSKCKDCLQSMENRKRVKRSAQAGTSQTEKAAKEPLSGRKSPHGAPGSTGSGKVRERLVYVVEEEGKDMTKLETDLFSVNEILTIKKDLLELSEFAKKLKKLKEMKRNAEKGKASKSACQCKPVAELLKNVNKRIEALEARQEELERGSHKTSQKGDTETESKKTTDPKTSSDSPPKTPVVRKQSAMTTVPSFPKTEMIVSRAGFSNNSEIVNELMDIKTQLQKLEKKRMSKELTPEAAPLGESNVTKKKDHKDHAIAVFSSRTYILTAENYEKTKMQLPTKAEGKVKGYFPGAENPRNRTEQTKENVANWLKSVSPIGERSENEAEIAVFLEAEKLQQEINTGQHNGFHCAHVFSGDGFQSQEPQKNRAPEVKSAQRDGTDLHVLVKNATKTRTSDREPISHLICKECVMTPSGGLFVKKSSDEFARDLDSGPKGPSPSQVRRSASSCSVPSRILAKGRLGRVKKVFRDSPKLAGSHSKSTQELSGSSSGCKEQRAVRDVKAKDLTSSPRREKIHKENKNEFVKRRESNLIALKDFGRGDDLLSSSSFSELIRTINLETEKPSDSIDRQEESGGNDMHIYSLATMTKFNFKGFEIRGKDEGAAKERAKERRKKEEEAAREAAKKENQKPVYRKRNEECSSRAADLGEKERNQKAEQEVCECVCCCKKKPKAQSVERKESASETCSTVDSRATPEISRSRERERRKRKSSSERVNFKKNKDHERRRKAGKSRSREKARRKESRERERKKKIKDCLRKSKTKRESSKRPKKKPSKSHIYCSHNRLPCKCQARWESSSCETESLPSRSCSREIQQPSEFIKPTVPTRPKAQSEDSIEVYLKRQNRRAQIEKEKLVNDSCLFGNIFKNLRRLYPKFSNFQLGNFSGDISERKPSRQHHQQQQQQQSQKRTMECLDGETTEEDDYEGYNERALRGSSSHSLNERQHQHRHRGHYNTSSPSRYYENSRQHHATKSGHLQNCKCVRVYLQTQGGQDWPGVLPFRSPSGESEDEVSSKCSIESRKTIKSDFIFPGRLPRSQCVGHSTERRRSRKYQGTNGCCRCRRNRHRKHRRKKEICVCDKCGHVHKKKKPKKKKEHHDDVQAKGNKCCECDNKTSEEKGPLEANKPAEPLHLPILSFLRHFCKSKHHSSKKVKSKSSLFQRVSKMSLRTYAQLKKKAKQQLQKDYCPPKTSGSCCNFVPKLTEIEDRLKNLEKKQDLCAGKKKKKKKKKKTKRDCCSAENVAECCELKRERRKKKKRKKKKHCICFDNSNTGSHETPESESKKKKKKEQERKKSCCCCPESCSADGHPNEIQTYWCTYPASAKTVETSGTNETSESLTTKTTTTTTTATTATTEDTVSSKPSQNEDRSPKRDWRLRKRLSSLQSLLNNFQRHRKPKPHTNNSTNIFVIKEPDLIDDYGKSCSMPRERLIHELKAGPSGFLKKIKKLKGKKSTKDKGDKKEKRKVVKEKRNPKSMS